MVKRLKKHSDKTVSEWEVKCKYRLAGVQKFIDAGVYTVQPPKKEGNLVNPSKGLPPGTRTANFSVLDGANSEVARCHGYILEGGRYGGSGMLDPKRLKFWDGLIYQARHVEPSKHSGKIWYILYRKATKAIMKKVGPCRCKVFRR